MSGDVVVLSNPAIDDIVVVVDPGNSIMDSMFAASLKAPPQVLGSHASRWVMTAKARDQLYREVVEVDASPSVVHLRRITHFAAMRIDVVG